MLSDLPLWSLGLGLFVLMIVGRELGYALMRRRAHDRPIGDSSEEFTLNAVMGLLALLIAFTFSLALARYETRRELVVSEANAMGTTWLRLDLLDAEPRGRARVLLKDYAAARLAYGRAETASERSAALYKADTLQGRFWEELMADLAPMRNTPLATMLLGPANEMIDLAGERTAAAEAHIPGRLLATLFLYCFVTASLIGYLRGKSRISTTLVFILLVITFGLVADLDRPTSGFIHVTQQPVIDFLHGTDN